MTTRTGLHNGPVNETSPPKLALSVKTRNDASDRCTRRCPLRYGRLLLLALFATGCARSAPLESNRLDCNGGVRIFAQNAAHCVYDPNDAPEMCADAVPHRYETANDVVCSALDDLSDQWLSTIIDASYVQDAAADLPVRDAQTDGELDAGGVRLDIDAGATSGSDAEDSDPVEPPQP